MFSSYHHVVAKANEVLAWLSGESEPATVVEPVGYGKHALRSSSHELEPFFSSSQCIAYLTGSRMQGQMGGALP